MLRQGRAVNFFEYSEPGVVFLVKRGDQRIGRLKIKPVPHLRVTSGRGTARLDRLAPENRLDPVLSVRKDRLGRVEGYAVVLCAQRRVVEQRIPARTQYFVALFDTFGIFAHVEVHPAEQQAGRRLIGAVDGLLRHAIEQAHSLFQIGHDRLVNTRHRISRIVLVLDHLGQFDRNARIGRCRRDTVRYGIHVDQIVVIQCSQEKGLPFQRRIASLARIIFIQFENDHIHRIDEIVET